MDGEALVARPVTPRDPWERRWPLVGLGLILLVLTAYWPATTAGYIWDDDDHILHNNALRSADGLWRIWTELGETPQYYPLTHTTFWLEFRLWGLDPRGYHVTNILLHALSSVVLWRLLRAMAIPGALVVAALFAVHPLHVESVAWITERKNVLAWLLYFCAFRVYWSMLGGLSPERPPGFAWERYVPAILLAIAALLSKTVTSTLPAAILLAIWWKRGTLRWRDALPLVPLFCIGAVLGSITSWMERTRVGAQGPEWDVLGFADRILIAGRALWFYAAKLVAPVNLSFNYERWAIDPHNLQQWTYPLAAALAVGALLLLRKRIGRGPLVAVLFYCGTIFPALGFFNVYPMRYSFVADHFAYPATVGLLCLIVGSLAASRIPRTSLVPLAGIIVLACVGLTHAHAYAFENAVTLWQDTLARNPDSWIAATNLAKDQLDQLETAPQSVRAAEAAKLEPILQRALRGRPGDPTATILLGTTQRLQSRADDALTTWLSLLDGGSATSDKALRVEALFRSGLCYYEDKRNVEIATQFYTQALREHPEHLLTLLKLASMLCDQGRYREAHGHLQTALNQMPYSYSIWTQAGDLYVEAKQYGNAIKALNKALEINPNHVPAKAVLALALARSGQNGQSVLDPLLAGHASDPDVVVTSALFAIDAGQTEHARKLADWVFTEYPHYPRARRLMHKLQPTPATQATAP